MKKITKTEFYKAPPETVFALLDDLGVTGAHMTQSSAAMMGSKLHLTFLTNNITGLHTKYRWTGTMMWMEMDFTVEVVKWIPAKEKIWETIGKAKMIIYSWYRMSFLLTPTEDGTIAELSIVYKKPQEWYYAILSFLFADLYCKWCLNKMLKDCKTILNNSTYGTTS